MRNQLHSQLFRFIKIKNELGVFVQFLVAYFQIIKHIQI